MMVFGRGLGWWWGATVVLGVAAGALLLVYFQAPSTAPSLIWLVPIAFVLGMACLVALILSVIWTIGRLISRAPR